MIEWTSEPLWSLVVIVSIVGGAALYTEWQIRRDVERMRAENDRKRANDRRERSNPPTGE